MQIISNITTFLGETPNKLQQSFQDFAGYIQSWIFWQSETAFPQMQTFIQQLNILADEINTINSNVENWKNQTENARDEAVGKVATLPNGTISNLTASETNTYSSSKIEELTNTKYIAIDSDFTAEAGHCVFADTTDREITVTLPENPKNFSVISVFDIAGNFANNKVTLMRNNKTIMNLEEDMTLSISNKTYKFVYFNDDWRIF